MLSENCENCNFNKVIFLRVETSENTTWSPFDLHPKMGKGVPKTGIIFISEVRLGCDVG